MRNSCVLDKMEGCKKMKKNILFDLDGTLFDTTEGIIESAWYAATKLGYERLPYEKMLQFVGPPIQESFMKHYNCTSNRAQEATEIFRNYYKQGALFKAAPYEGIYELFDELQALDIKMAVATYKGEDLALKILGHFGMDKYCCSIHGADNNNKLKKSDIINICLNEMKGDRQESVLIGDTMNDARGAADANIDFIAVTYGFGYKVKEELEKYPYIGVAKSPREILDLIKNL